MESPGLLVDLLIVFALAAAVVFILQWLRIPSIVGLLVAGMFAGPYGLGWVGDIERVETLAEVGVVVLLFTVGLEFSLPRLAGMGRLMARVGLLQVLLTGGVGLAATWAYFGDVRPAVLVGMLLAMSSTAVVFKLLTDRGDLSSPQGTVAAAVLLFQDLLVVACMVVLPQLGREGGDAASAFQSVFLGALVVLAVIVTGRYVVPFVLYQVVRTNHRELFLMVLVLVCLGSSALTAWMGWSLALGAFLAGLTLSESDYASQTLAEMLPFRDTLASLFFVSIGMLLDLRFLFTNLPLVGLTVVAVLTLKFLAGALPTLLAGYPLRIAILTGAALAQIGEFSFILADRGLTHGLLGREQYQLFLAAAVLTVAVTPLLFSAAPRVADGLAGWAESRRWRWAAGGAAGPAESASGLSGHVVILGFGHTGRSLARVLRTVNVSYAALDLNPQTVREARRQGESIHYGDGTRPSVLARLGIDSARAMVVAISDPSASRRVVQTARRLHPGLLIIVRTRYLADVEELRALGATAVIPEEFESSVEIFARVLRAYDVPRNVILELIHRAREDHYEVLRDVKLPAVQGGLPLDVVEQLAIESCLLRPDSPALGRSLEELDLRAATGATLMAVRRQGELLLNPTPRLVFEPGDVVILIGSRPQVDQAVRMFDPAWIAGVQP
jgi:CPA2 family monovalent cation:H+ antiporter-2